MSLRDRILSDLKDAMRAQDSTRVSTLRLIQAAIKDRDIAARQEDRCDGCDLPEIQAILQKLLKQREESAETYENAGRLDLAERERAEAEIVSSYLPEPMKPAEIAQAAQSVVSELDAGGLKDMGRCMAALKERYTGRMDFAKAGKEVKTLLQGQA
ncbi:GatB/YqeY domain-containing protein [Oceanicaulis alexandrii]|uniref:GatB/YqeY domain-containing protein n=1 Tax=Oceanicaulis alexandrii TaxID=153233 RepID=UPI0003B6D0B1|nr:GatB/YqeY domain-containing protein [Oceanicaulis alexandrii]